MSKDSPWAKRKPSAKLPKTFYLNPIAMEQLAAAQAAALDPDAIIEEIRIAIEGKIRALYDQRPVKDLSK